MFRRRHSFIDVFQDLHLGIFVFITECMFLSTKWSKSREKLVSGCYLEQKTFLQYEEIPIFRENLSITVLQTGRKTKFC